MLQKNRTEGYAKHILMQAFQIYQRKRNWYDFEHILSWLPNFLDSRNADYHTRYVCNISYYMINSTIQSWQVDFRYSNIKDLYFIVQKYASEINSICPMIETFPLSTVSQGLFGIDDKVRNERMNKFDLWLRELIMNPLAMTIWEIVEATYLFLEFNKHIYET